MVANSCSIPTQRVSDRSGASVTVAVCDSDGDGIANSTDLDDDNDGIPDTQEGYNVSNPSASRDTDGDGIFDYIDLDSDNDGVNDVREAGGIDANNDGRADGAVNANGVPASAGPGGLTPPDSDGDGKPNAYDLDSDNDGITDLRESGNAALADANNDGKVDGTADTDKDGIVGSADGAPATWGDAADPALADTDGDGVPNMKDLDSDNDGKSDLSESGNPTAIAGDIDNDGVIDFGNNDPDGDGALTPGDGTPTFGTNTPAPADTDGDGIPDYKDPVTGAKQDIDDTPYADADTNNDGVINGSDTGGAADADGDGIPDVMDNNDNQFGGLPSNLRVTVKAFLRGAFVGARHKDVSANWMNVLKQFALSQPYHVPAFDNYAGTEAVTAATFTATTADNDVVDWVLLELKKADGTLADRHAALILENGNIVGTDKASPVFFKALPGTYHLTIRHRNHLGLSTELLTLTAASNTFDFTTATDAMLFGDTAAFTTMNGKTLLRGGNANSNVNVRFNGPANDRDAIFGYLGGDETGFITDVYAPQDINMDGAVRYNGPGNDRDFLLLLLGGNESGFITQQIK